MKASDVRTGVDGSATAGSIDQEVARHAFWVRPKGKRAGQSNRPPPADASANLAQLLALNAWFDAVQVSVVADAPATQAAVAAERLFASLDGFSGTSGTRATPGQG
jgi:hypothetical protein